MVGCAGIRRIGHECCLGWFDLRDDFHIPAGEWVSFYVELDGEHFCQLIYIGVFYVPLVWSGMNRYTVCAGFDYRLGCFYYARYSDIPLVSQESDFI